VTWVTFENGAGWRPVIGFFASSNIYPRDKVVLAWTSMLILTVGSFPYPLKSSAGLDLSRETSVLWVIK
jgi:hypothetical protein